MTWHDWLLIYLTGYVCIAVLWLSEHFKTWSDWRAWNDYGWPPVLVPLVWPVLLVALACVLVFIAFYGTFERDG